MREGGHNIKKIREIDSERGEREREKEGRKEARKR